MGFSDYLIVLVAALSLVSLSYGFWRENRRSARDQARREAQLYLANLRLQLRLDAAHRELRRLEREMQNIQSLHSALQQQAPHTAHGGISISGSAQVTVQGDAVAGDEHRQGRGE